MNKIDPVSVISKAKPVGGVHVENFGCRLNAVEAEAMRVSALAAGHDNTIIINTCAVTAEAVRQARQSIRKARRDNPSARIIVTGCAAQTEPEHFALMEEIDHIIGNDIKTKPETWLKLRHAESERVLVNDIMSVRETAMHMIDGLKDRARAFVQVQNGCDHRCTFCIIPYGRGNSRSIPMGAVVEQIKRLVDFGYLEVVLTGVDLTSYGTDLPGTPALGMLVDNIIRHVPDLPRLRISSIDSIEADEMLVDLITGEQRIMPHLHLSLQSGDNMILKRMKRRHSREDAVDFCLKLRAKRPDIAFGADFITGFPTETEEMFGNTLKLVDECGLTFLHVFPFSARKNTPAAKMPQLDKSIIKERAQLLRQKGEAVLIEHLKAQQGVIHNVLIERQGRGRTGQFTQVYCEGGEPGTIEPMIINDHTDDVLLGVRL